MLAGFVDAMRWGTVTSADPNRYLAPFWSGVNIEAYQLSSSMPLATLPLARGLIIGDDRDGQPDMIDRFRRSGLSHLPAVVGSERTSIH